MFDQKTGNKAFLFPLKSSLLLTEWKPQTR